MTPVRRALEAAGKACEIESAKYSNAGIECAAARGALGYAARAIRLIDPAQFEEEIIPDNVLGAVHTVMGATHGLDRRTTAGAAAILLARWILRAKAAPRAIPEDTK